MPRLRGIVAMIELHAFGPGFGLPDPSPFCMKADLLLQMSGLPFERKRGNMRKAPKGKLPMIVDNGETIADSTFIRLHLERRHGIDLDKGLTPEQRGAAWAVEKMLEDHLYWMVVQERWTVDANFDRGPRHFFQVVPAPLRPFVIAMIRRKVRQNLHAHGMGRYTPQERLELARQAVGAVAAVLGERRFLMRDEPCWADATVGAFMVAGLSPLFESPLRGVIEDHPNLVAYAARIRAAYFDDREGLSSAA